MHRRLFIAAAAAAPLAACATVPEAAETAPPPVPADGKWFIDPTRSSFSNQPFPPNMSLTLDIKFADGKVIYNSVNNTNKDNPPYVSNFATPLDGSPSPFEEQSRFNQVAVLQLAPTEFRVLKMKDGDVVVGEFWRFLPDGKTLVRSGVGKNAEGRSRAFQEYFTRLP
jgi:hypothetical protein